MAQKANDTSIERTVLRTVAIEIAKKALGQAQEEIRELIHHRIRWFLNDHQKEGEGGLEITSLVEDLSSEAFEIALKLWRLEQQREKAPS